mmetsp:Transcript_6835/g.15005  ORF Transcript_6835/g.15005 Transcript_6835/m.15005 type:complete len:204 (+) Transcript_6835:836-1447(+)
MLTWAAGRCCCMPAWYPPAATDGMPPLTAAPPAGGLPRVCRRCVWTHSMKWNVYSLKSTIGWMLKATTERVWLKMRSCPTTRTILPSLHMARCSTIAPSASASIHFFTSISPVPSSIVYCRLVLASSARIITPTMVTWWTSCPSTVKVWSPTLDCAFFSCFMVTGSSDCRSFLVFPSGPALSTWWKPPPPPAGWLAWNCWPPK